MRISGNEPSSVILRQTKWFQTLRMIAQKCQIKLKFNSQIMRVKVKIKVPVVSWLVGSIEDLRRFSGISAISRLGSRR